MSATAATSENGLSTVTSSDGTSIAFERAGNGPPIIFVVGAFNDRSTAQPLAALLAADFTVITYDRRGRGASGDAPAYAIEREIEDLQALIAAAGGSASVFGYSSGALLALKAAAQGLGIDKLALYEPPYNMHADRPETPEHTTRLAELIAAGHRGDAVEYFQREMVGIPAEVVAQMRHAPFRPALEAMGHTLVYEAAIVNDRALPGQLASVRVATLVIDGAASPPPLRNAAHALVDALPHAQARTLEGQGHDIVPAVVAPLMAEFLAAR